MLVIEENPIPSSQVLFKDLPVGFVFRRSREDTDNLYIKIQPVTLDRKLLSEEDAAAFKLKNRNIQCNALDLWTFATAEILEDEMVSTTQETILKVTMKP